MDGRDDSPGTGRHLLGPHVVGTRVVVRHLVRGERGPSGGPALTDVLGVCTAWGEDVVLRREDGREVVVPRRDIVAGKPVPPRPSVRQRVSAHDVERHVLSLWPEVEAEPVGDWLARSSGSIGGRLPRRANSVLAVRDPGLPFAEAEAAVRSFYEERGRVPLAQVLVGDEPERAFLERGWTPLPTGRAVCLLGSVARALRACGADDDEDADHATWGDATWEDDGPRVRVVLGNGVARGSAAVDHDWVGLHSLVVDPAHRRRGLATRVIGLLLDRAAERGATTAWLHVETTNGAAAALYRGLGFAEHHEHRYLAAGE
jgi:ribosomal protein S18 acetylase RimI-like enzyme